MSLAGQSLRPASISAGAVSSIVVLSFVAAASLAEAQGPVTPAALAAQVAEAKKAAAERRTQQAVELADAVLTKDPRNADAIVVKVQALAEADDLDGAIVAYEEFRLRGGAESADALRPLALAHLRDLSENRTSTVAAGALEALARSGHAASREALVKRAWPTEKDAAPSQAAIDALARLGDPKAVAEVAARLDAPMASAKQSGLDVLVVADPARVVAALPALAKERDPGLRTAAIDAAGRAGRREAIPTLKSLVGDEMYLIRLSAAVALKRLGDPSGDAVLATALKSELNDARLLAARGYVGSTDRSWVAALLPVLEDPNGFNRFFAAELLAPVEPEKALPVLEAGVADPNPAVRDVALKALLAQSSPPSSKLWPLLRDVSPWVRVQAATALAR